MPLLSIVGCASRSYHSQRKLRGLYGLQAPLPLASPQRIELRTVVFGAQLAALEHWGLFGGYTSASNR